MTIKTLAIVFFMAILIGIIIIRSSVPNASSMVEMINNYFIDRDDYQLFICVNQAWEKAEYLNKNEVKINSEIKRTKEFVDFLLAYPMGEIIQNTRPELDLPKNIYWIKIFPITTGQTIKESILSQGNKFLEIKFGESRVFPNSKNDYSTKITNISEYKIKVNKFGGFVKTDKVYILNSISNSYFNSIQFINWYGQKSEWLSPGESVIDYNNYGSSPILWVYFFSTENGSELAAGVKY